MTAETVDSGSEAGLIEFNGYLIEKMISEHELHAITQRLADEIYRDYKGKKLLLVGVLKGANLFLGDIVRELGRGNPEIGRSPMPVEFDFLQVSSYAGGTSTGNVQKQIDISSDIKNRDVILVEDIVDTGNTLTWIKSQLTNRHPSSLSVCVLLDKPDRREVFLKPEYTGKTIPNKFVIGNGLDYNQEFRNLPFIGIVVGPTKQGSTRQSV
jgi:hypoxanthine phosphoribosyltransferase